MNMPVYAEEEVARWRLLALFSVAVAAMLTVLLVLSAVFGPIGSARERVNTYRIELVGKSPQINADESD